MLQTIISLPWLQIIEAIGAISAALIALFVLIPGEQPEKTLQKVVDLIRKISRK
jgi:hypothetical protein